MAALTPTVVYRDLPAAIAWLERAFGFEVSLMLTFGQGAIAHAEMSFQGLRIGVAGEWAGPQLGGARMRSPQSLDGQCTQFLWISLDEGLDAHCQRARAPGARITQDPESQFYGDRTYRAADLEGHVWSFSQKERDVSTAEAEAASGLTYKVGG